MKKTLLSILLFFPLLISAQATYGNLPPLYVDGDLLKDVHGNVVRLYGVSDCPNPANNANRWGEGMTDADITKCASYFTKVFNAITKTGDGAHTNAIRLAMEPAWASDASKVEQGLPEYQCLSTSRLKSNTTKLYWKIIQGALKKGLYVVMASPETWPAEPKQQEAYQQYLADVWETFTQNDSILKYSGLISLDLTAASKNLSAEEAKAFNTPIVEKIRANGYGGIIWQNEEGPRFKVAAQWSEDLKNELDGNRGLSVFMESTDAFLNMDTYLESVTAVAAEGAQGCWDYYTQLAQTYPTFNALKRIWNADQGNGTFINPILNGDFPDVDIIRVGDTYYLMSTTMFIFPGATIMKSKDLVNWEYCCNPLEKIDDSDAYNLLNGKDHYAQGQWATSMRYHDGKFYVYFIAYGRNGVDNGRNVLLTATDPEGKWTMKYMDEHYYDSGWLFDDGPDGDGYLYVACGIGALYVNKLDAKTLKKISSTKIFERDATEGSRMYHIGEYYYVYVTTGGYWRGQTIYRSKNPMGPYEEMPNLNKYGNEQSGNAFTNNAIHQGGLVETQTGEWWTIMFRDAGAIGRVPYLEPVVWKDGWPIIGNNGVDVSKNSKPYRKPNVGSTYPRTYLPSTDSFTSLHLGKQWGWNHNHDDSKWSLLERPGYLRLHTVNVTNNLKYARNSLTQRIMGLNPEGSTKTNNSYGTIKMDVSGMMEGDVAGLSVFQDPYSLLGVKVKDGKKYLVYMQAKGDDEPDATKWVPKEKQGPELKSNEIYLRSIVNYTTSKCNFYYSYDNKTWTKFGDEMSMRFQLSIFVGQRFYIFNYATKQTGGFVDIDWFSTEATFSEDMFYGEDMKHAYPVEEVTAVSLKADKNEVNMMPGSFAPITLTCTLQSGNKIDVTSACTYTSTTPNIVNTMAGKLVGAGMGNSEITATYTDALGNQVSTTFNVNVSYFPLDVDAVNANLLGSGGLVRKSTDYTIFKPGKTGMVGWHYEQGVDLSSQGRYLVMRLNRTVTSKPELRLYDVNDVNATEYYAFPAFGSDTLAVFDLQEAAQTIDLSHIYYVGVYCKTSSAVQIIDFYLSDDGTNPTAIKAIDMEPQTSLLRVEFFAPDGRQVSTLQPGINIVRRIFSDGHTETIKIRK